MNRNSSHYDHPPEHPAPLPLVIGVLLAIVAGLATAIAKHFGWLP